MKFIVYFIYTFAIFFVVYFTILFIRYRLGRINHISEVRFLINKYKLNLKEIKKVKLVLYISLINSFIISLASGILYYLVNNVLLMLVIGVVLLLILIYIGYMRVFKILINKKVFDK